MSERTTSIPIRRQLLWNVLAEMRRSGTTVLLVTHNLAEAERVLDRLAIIDRGRIVQEGSPAQLRSLVTHRLRLEMTGNDIEPHDCLLPDPGNPGAFLLDMESLPAVTRCRLGEDGSVDDRRLPHRPADTLTTSTALRCEQRNEGGGLMRKFGALTLLMFQMNRQAMVLITVVNMGFGLGLVIGFGYLIPGIGEEIALLLVTGAATRYDRDRWPRDAAGTVLAPEVRRPPRLLLRRPSAVRASFWRT